MAKFQFFGGGTLESKLKILKGQEMAKFQFFGGCTGVKTENTQSAKKWLNFNFLGGCTLESKLKILKVPRNG